MAKLGKAVVHIHANLKPLKRGLAAAKKAVSLAMNSIKKIATVAFSVAKKAVMAFAAASGAATYAALKQEAALVELGSALKFVGAYSEENVEKFKRFAAEIQKVTVFGDEEVLAMMRMGLPLLNLIWRDG